MKAETATNSGTFSDVDLPDLVTIAASIGNVTQDPGNSGYWIWELPTTDNLPTTEVEITAQDDHGGVSTLTFTVTVGNVNPTPVIESINAVRVEGTSITVTASATDPAGTNDTLTYSYSVLKNGASFATGLGVDQTSFSFSPDDNGSYQITLTVSDEDGGSAVASQTISVGNVNPTPVIESIGAVRLEGTAVLVAASATDPAGANDTLTYSYSVLKNGSAYASGSGVDQTSFSFAPYDNGSYQITLAVSDEDGGSAVTSQTITVNNVIPIITGLAQLGSDQ